MVEEPKGMLRRRAKIVATVGPATDDVEVLTQMMLAGLDVVRLNASHGTVEDRRRRLGLVREAARRADRCVGVLLDLGGPKIRIDCFREGPVQLTEGAPFILDTTLDPKAGTVERVGIAYNIKPTNTVLRISYARTLETPFNENLIIATEGCNVPVIAALIPCVPANSPAGFRNEFHSGFQQAFGKYLVLDGEYLWKYTHNGYDFGVLAATPIALPITWNNSKITGYTFRASVPR